MPSEVVLKILDHRLDLALAFWVVGSAEMNAKPHGAPKALEVCGVDDVSEVLTDGQ